MYRRAFLFWLGIVAGTILFADHWTMAASVIVISGLTLVLFLTWRKPRQTNEEASPIE